MHNAKWARCWRYSFFRRLWGYSCNCLAVVMLKSNALRMERTCGSNNQQFDIVYQGAETCRTHWQNCEMLCDDSNTSSRPINVKTTCDLLQHESYQMQRVPPLLLRPGVTMHSNLSRIARLSNKRNPKQQTIAQCTVEKHKRKGQSNYNISEPMHNTKRARCCRHIFVPWLCCSCNFLAIIMLKSNAWRMERTNVGATIVQFDVASQGAETCMQTHCGSSLAIW